MAIKETPTGYECDDPRVEKVEMFFHETKSPPILMLVLYLADGDKKTFGGKPFCYTDKLIAEAEEWLKTLDV
jgi:hypothetical protein